MEHQFIKTGDPDAHPSIQDSNGEVVLDQCRVCGQAEGGLAPTCPGPPMATPEQKTEIIRLLNHPLISRHEKTKMLLALNKLSVTRATEAIEKIQAAITSRENGAPIPEAPPVDAANRIYSFYDLQRCAQDEVKMRKQVYGGRVAQNKMTEEKASTQTEMMERIALIMRGLSTGDYQLIDTWEEKNTRILESRPLR